ncbi:MAG TPA: HEAT repeat domain-containing protein, partial [Polyangiaceae bacterium]|nr:HEAT repeat domain-containing protein [Polyangiaceae bacterium]
PPSAAPTRLSPMPPAPDAAEVAPRTHQYSDAPFARSARSKTYSGLGPGGAERPLTLDFNPTPRGERVVEASVAPDAEEEVQRTSVVPQRVVSIGAAAPAAQPAATPYDSSELSRTQMSPRDQQPATTPLPASPKTSEAGWGSDSPRPAALIEAAATSPISPDIHVGEADLDRDVLDAIARDERAPLAPASRSIAYSARPPSRRQSSEELRLPSVIVDFESDSRALVHRLCAGDPEAGEKLVEMGAAAVSALVAEFPGPITQPLSRGSQESLQRASECGPLLKTLARIGAPAVPFLVVRTADTQPFVRGWATRLLGELANRESGVAVARRLVDDNPEVRRAALAAARMLQRDPVARAAIREYIADLARDRNRSNEARHAALEALSDVRDAEAVPVFIEMLQDPNLELVKSARWGLTVLTRTDLGDKAHEWEKWWRKNAGRHRIEWLIDSLMHDDADIRRAAGDELKSITKEYFGYYDDLPKRERAGAQARYREWWEGKGKSRFALN